MFLHHTKKKRYPVIIGIGITLVLFGGIGFGLHALGKYIFSPIRLLESDIVRKQVQKELGIDNTALFDILPQTLGFTEPQTYLLLLQNNTELRPGGGFIGLYGILHVDKGKMSIAVLDGTENLDRLTPASWKPVAPRPITDYLKTDRWFFRDSNWSPDFSVSAKKALELYTGEQGQAAADIDAVIAVTPTVLEEILRITGPFPLQDMEFTADNVVEKLEYEVEYNYVNRGIPKANRKDIIKPFALALSQQLKDDFFSHYETYSALIERMIEEKHIIGYWVNPEVQKKIEHIGMAGSMVDVPGDYLLWVDANLTALKTDHAMKRDITYSLAPADGGRFMTTVIMTYTHTGKFDWRTTRYRTYMRVFVPVGSVLVEGPGSPVDQGVEEGKQWFGTFVSIEPGDTKTVAFRYMLPDILSKQIEEGSYTLFVQKQLGTIAHGLTVNLDFDKIVTSASPAEKELKWGDDVYALESDLRVDRKFEVHF